MLLGSGLKGVFLRGTQDWGRYPHQTQQPMKNSKYLRITEKRETALKDNISDSNVWAKFHVVSVNSVTVLYKGEVRGKLVYCKFRSYKTLYKRIIVPINCFDHKIVDMLLKANAEQFNLDETRFQCTKT